MMPATTNAPSDVETDSPSPAPSARMTPCGPLADGTERECLASIIELSPRTARIESARPLEKGCR
jgi:hypothetical protein